MMNAPSPIQSLEFDAATLLETHPPVWRHSHKKAIYDRVLREGRKPQTTLRFTRWRCARLSGEMAANSCEVVPCAGYYTYSKSGPGIWHLNFADPRLFAAYGSPLMAQDEWQVLEHPVLGSLRESLMHDGHPALTCQDGVSTPVLVTNVPRQCAVDLNPPAAQQDGSIWGRVKTLFAASSMEGRSLYGNAFRAASIEQVQASTRVFEQPFLSNVIAVAAPTGSGRYTHNQIAGILETAACAFRAARSESARLEKQEPGIEVHTGWWGCGAFGGNRVLMCLLQVLAARIAGVDRLVFHYGPAAERFHFDEAVAHLDQLVTSTSVNLEQVLREIQARGYEWGTSDGN